MRIRTQILVVLLGLVLVPMGLLLVVVRGEMTDRLTAEHQARVQALLESVETQLDRERERLSNAAASMANAMLRDNDLRLALSEPGTDSPYLVDYGSRILAAAALDVVQLQDESGRVLTSGHFREDFGSVAAVVSTASGADSQPPPVMRLRVPEGTRLALVAVTPARIGGRSLNLTVGRWLDGEWFDRLAPDSAMAVGLVAGGSLLSGRSVTGATRELPVALLELGADGGTHAAIRVAHRLDSVRTLLRSLDVWLLSVFGATALAAVLAAMVASARITRPVADLAESTALVDLDRPGIRLLGRRRDEIGLLSRTMDAMVRRMRGTAAKLRDAERQAALGDFARQANHDVKNGLVPIRNVFSHLNDVAGHPDELQQVFDERRDTIASGIAYLEKLATAYARMSYRPEPIATDLVDAARNTAMWLAAADPRVGFRGVGTARVSADPLALRRIVENLTANALESLRQDGGQVWISAHRDTVASRARLEVSDNGAGIAPEVREHLFDDFFSTRADGPGLGLSIVRRLVMDMGGTIDVESEPGQGSVFAVSLPLLDC